MDDRLLAFAVALGLLVGAYAAFALGRLWRRVVLRLRFGRARRREEAAAHILVRGGYTVLATQVTAACAVERDGEPLAPEVRADYLVSRRGRVYVAEAKSGARATDLRDRATRRQLLEYAITYDVDGVLLVDTEAGTVAEVVFPALKRPPARGFWAGMLVGAAVVALLWGGCGERTRRVGLRRGTSVASPVGGPMRLGPLSLLVLAACSDNGIAVVKSPPAVTITAPVAGTVLVEAQPFTIAVKASDRETTTADLDLVYSLEDGTLLTGTPTVVDDTVSLLVPGGLSLGDHTITVLVTDADALSDDDAVAVSVVAPPVLDADGDGHDDALQGGDDCDDTDAAVHPGAPELCNGADDDCDGLTDEDDATDAPLFHADADGDTYGDPGVTTHACAAPAGFVADATDCDDADAATFPGATELCNGADDDCDGVIDEPDAADAPTWYADTDADTYGSPTATTRACALPAGFVADATDCDDADGAEHPGATEVCDGDDDDCDGTIDEPDAIDAPTWYADSDADAYGNIAVTTRACAAPAGYTADATDCDDTDGGVHPGAAEACDGIDQDCDGTIDEGVKLTFYADADGDGYGNAAVSTSACTAAAGWVADATDCDDTDGTEHPGASEVCDGDDDDCDGTTDEDSAIDAATWYRDADGDGYGATSPTHAACSQPSGYVASATDCDDTDAGVSPASTEVCADGIDQDCDGADPACPLEGSIALTDADASVYGASSWMQVGFGVADGGDLDDDGQDDVLVTGNDTMDNGDAWVFFSDITGDNSTSTADVYIHGDDNYDNFGLQRGNAAGGQDLNGDGSDDLVVGASGDDLYATTSGTAFVFYGPLSGTLGPQADADYLYSGATANDFAGNSVALVGDMTGDRYAELLVGAYGQDSGGSVAGAAYLNFGPLTGYRSGGTSLAGSDVVLVGEDATDYFSWLVADVGDWDGDGLDDILVGAYGDDDGGSEAGAAYIFTGLTGGTVDASAADYKVHGEAAGDRFGWTGSAAGDINGDGYADMVVGAYKNDDGGTDAGAVYLVTGNRTGSASASGAHAEIYGAAAGDYAGYAVSANGDVDGDGNPDLLVGAWKNDGGASDGGAAYLLYGPLSGTTDISGADASMTGPDTYDYAGESVSFIGDTNNDGLTDLLIGVYGANAGSTSAGQAYLFLGAPR